MIKKFIKQYWLLILIFIAATPIRLYNIDFPFLDYHDFRQTQTATVALNFYKHGINFLSSELDIFGNGKEKYLLLEFPLYQGIVAFLYKLFYPTDLLGRIVSIMMGYGGAIYLYRLVILIYENKNVAFSSVFFFLFAPLNIYFQRTFMIEPMVITLVLAYLFYSCDWIMRGSNKSLLLALVTGILGFVSKGSYGPFWLLPIVWLYLKKKGLRADFRLIIIIVLPLLVLIGWQKYTDYFNSLHGHDYFTSKTAAWRIWNFGVLSDRFDREMWHVRINNLQEMFTKLGLGASILGLFWALKYDKNKFLYAWILAAVVYFLTFFRIQSHNYYQMAIIPPVSVAAAFGLWYAARFLVEILFKHFSNLRQITLVMILLIFCFLYIQRSWRIAKGFFVINWDYAKQLDTIKVHTDPKYEVIFVLPDYDWSSTITYYTQRKGKVIASYSLDQKLVNLLIRQNYGSLVLFSPNKYLNISQEKYTFLKQYEFKFQDKDLIIYRLL